jgi:hypothetical protein
MGYVKVLVGIKRKSGHKHRNLSTRMRMFELLLQTFWAKKPCEKSADIHPRQGNLPTILEHFSWAQQNLSLHFAK